MASLEEVVPFNLGRLELQCPHISDKIFAHMDTFDTGSLLACRAVSQSWMNQVSVVRFGYIQH